MIDCVVVCEFRCVRVCVCVHLRLYASKRSPIVDLVVQVVKWFILLGNTHIHPVDNSSSPLFMPILKEPDK